ncbi:UNVERIFIED_CONTAM: hypothetical protein HDU68_002018 [Siphonaria sp. JEL0065]|nr:hypothetical protein HDU68_002018 [Siphonaria sp. JEL0065]
MNFVAICGSLRTRSSNAKLLESVKLLLSKHGHSLEHLDVALLPFFNPTLDSDDTLILPPQVSSFRSSLHKSHGLVISTPEYAHGIPGSIANALNWLVSDPSFPATPIVLVLGSGTDAYYCRAAITEILKTMSNAPIATHSVQGSHTIGSRGVPEAIVNELEEKIVMPLIREAERVVACLDAGTERVNLENRSHEPDSFHTQLLSLDDLAPATVLTFFALAFRLRESQVNIQKALVDQEMKNAWIGFGNRKGDVAAVAIRDDIPMSCAWVRTGDKNVFELWIGTVHSFRGKGFGRASLTKLLDILKSEYRGSVVSLSVQVDNPAIRLFKSFNFLPVKGSEFRDSRNTKSLKMSLLL